MAKTLTLKTREQLSEDFIVQFARSGRELREPPFDAWAPSEAYVRMLLALPRRCAFVLLTQGDKVLGRAAVFLSSTTVDQAFIGLYEVDLREDHAAHSRQILAAAMAWAKDQGVRKVYGPLDAGTFYNYRFRVDSDPRAYSWEPNQPAAYVSHWRDFGFKVSENYSSVALADGPYLPIHISLKTMKPLEFIATWRGYSFHPFSKVWSENMDMLYTIVAESFTKNVLYEPLARADFDRLYGDFKADFSPSFVLKNRSGKTVGFCLSYYDNKSLVVKTVGLLPSERGQHLGLAIFARSVLFGVKPGIIEVVSALTRSGNKPDKFTNFFRKLGVGGWSHSYELYELDVDRKS